MPTANAPASISMHAAVRYLRTDRYATPATMCLKLQPLMTSTAVHCAHYCWRVRTTCYVLYTASLQVYEVQGLLYYAGVDHFLSQFDAANDPALVEVLLHQADLCDYSAMQVCFRTLLWQLHSSTYILLTKLTAVTIDTFCQRH
jgi:hypothetical protein